MKKQADPELVSLDHARNLGLTDTDLSLLEDLDPLEPKLKVKVTVKEYPRDAVNFLHSMGLEKREEIKSLLSLENDRCLAAYTKKCRDVVASWKTAKPKMDHSKESKLSLDVWSRILEHLCDELQHKDIRGPSVVARDLCNASMTCKDLYAASLSAFQRLSSLCAEKEMEHQWQCLLSDPCNSDLLSDEVIATLLRRTKLRQFGSREINVHTLYRAVGQSQPTRLPARLILTVAEEKSQIKCLSEYSKWSEAKLLQTLGENQEREAVSQSQDSDFHYRARLTQLGISNLRSLRELCKHVRDYAQCKVEASFTQRELKSLHQELSKAEAEHLAQEEKMAKALTYCHEMGFDPESDIRPKFPGLRKSQKIQKLSKDHQPVSSNSFSRLLRKYDLLIHANCGSKLEVQSG